MPTARISLFPNEHTDFKAEVRGLEYDTPWLDLGNRHHALVVHGSLGQLQEFAAQVTAAVRDGIAADARRLASALAGEARLDNLIGASSLTDREPVDA